MVPAGTVYVPPYVTTPVARVMSVSGSELLSFRSNTEGSVYETDQDTVRGFVGSIAEPEDGELNLRAEETTRKAVRQAASLEKERMAAHSGCDLLKWCDSRNWRGIELSIAHLKRLMQCRQDKGTKSGRAPFTERSTFGHKSL